MNESNSRGFFWPSYVDIMTSLFAVTLVLFILSFSRFKIEEEKLRKLADKQREIESVYRSIENIDSTYFKYNNVYQKFIFNISVNYPAGVFDIQQITEPHKLPDIIRAGKTIKETIEGLKKDTAITIPVKYLVVIEGQASADGYNSDEWRNNDVLSYQRAMKLKEFWRSENGGKIDFEQMKDCELLVCGSGERGIPREKQEHANQRFLIHIVPYVGKLSTWGHER